MELSYSQAGAEVLPELTRRLNVVVLRHIKGQRFEILIEPPEWFRQVFAQAETANAIDLRSASLFLDSFHSDAEEHWINGRPEPLKSGVWHEYDAHDTEHYLEATALFMGGIPILAIESLGHDYEVRVQLFQKARNFVLQNQSLDFEIQKNDILLHFLTTDLSPPLQHVAELLNDLRVVSSLDPSSRQKVEEMALVCRRQQGILNTFLQSFSAEILSMQQISRDLTTSPDIIEAARTLVKAELDHFLSRSVGLSMESAVTPGESSRVVGHRQRLEKLLGSLMHLALRRAPQGSSIKLRVHVPSPEWIQVDLYESVASLTAVETNIFEDLLASENLVRKSALALYFCKITVERWGGEIGYRLSGDQGCWWIRLRRVR